MQSVHSVEQDRRFLKLLSILLLVIAVAVAGNFIATITSGDLSAPIIAETANTTQDLARTSILIIHALVAVELLVLIYLGIMGLIQSQGKPVGKSHIVIAKICFVFLALALIVVIISLFNSPNKDWVGLCSSVVNVCLCVYYISTARRLNKA